LRRRKDEEWVEEASAKPEKADPRIARLEEENARLSKQLGLIDGYHAAAGAPPEWMRPKKKPKPGAATACLQLSDLHLDETVDPAQVGGLGAYSRAIAEMRLRRWADKACEMGERHRHEWDGSVVFLDGDLVSGSIHEELVETNADHLPGTMVHWAPLLAAALRQVADFYGRVHVPAVVGNHGRLTQKKQAKGRGRNSWDWLLAQMVHAHLKGDERITFDIAEGSYLLVPIYKDFVYETHGDEAGGGSGWSGVWTPLMTIHRKGCELAAAHGIRIAYSVVGHWHRSVLAHSQGISCNGAMKGVDEWTMSMRFKPETPSQNWFVHTPERGVTLAGALFLEDRRREGW
jgi:hypothetical protein